MKENEEFLEEINDNNEDENDFNEISKNIKNNENQFVIFDVFFYFTIKNKEFVFQIKSDLFNINKQYKYELIKNVVKKINEKSIIINDNNTNYIISLKDCDDSEDVNDKNFYIKNYEIKQCNPKSLTPLKDILEFSSNSLLKKIDSQKLSFISKTPLNIMIREKIESEKDEDYNKYQFYYEED